MGFNSVVFILNDTISDIEKDPKGWWDRTWDALRNIPGQALTKGEARKRQSPGRSSYDLEGVYGFGSSANGYKAVWNCHADVIGLIAVGGNMATVVHTQYGRLNHASPDGQVQMLEAWAKKLGYRLVKEKRRKGDTSNDDKVWSHSRKPDSEANG